MTYEEFTTKAELIELHKSIDMRIFAQSITQKQYNEVIKPLHKWITQLRVLKQPNFAIDVSKEVNHLVIRLQPLANYDTIETTIMIPEYVRNIAISPFFLNKMNIKIALQNHKSLLITKSSYRILLELLLKEKIEANTKLYYDIEKTGINMMNHNVPKLNEEKILYFRNSIVIDLLAKCILKHSRMLGISMSQHEISTLQQHLEIISNIHSTYKEMILDSTTYAEKAVKKLFSRIKKEMEVQENYNG